MKSIEFEDEDERVIEEMLNEYDFADRVDEMIDQAALEHSQNNDASEFDLDGAIKKLAASGLIDKMIDATAYSDELKELLTESFNEIPPKYADSIKKANNAIKPEAGSVKILYLLIDGRLWKPGGSFAEFINAIFYVGQGSSIRWRDHFLYSLLFEDYEEIVSALDLNCEKEKTILKIWEAGSGVYVIKPVNAGNLDSVKFAEYAVLETIGTLSLTNKIKGASLSVPKGFDKNEVVVYGAALLIKSYLDKSLPIAVLKNTYSVKQQLPTWPPSWFRQIARDTEASVLESFPREKIAFLLMLLGKNGNSADYLAKIHNEDIRSLVADLKNHYIVSWSKRLRDEDPEAYEAYLERERSLQQAARDKLKENPVAYEAYLEKERIRGQAARDKLKKNPEAYKVRLEKNRIGNQKRRDKLKEDPEAHEAHLEKERIRHRVRLDKLREDPEAHEAHLKKERIRHRARLDKLREDPEAYKVYLEKSRAANDKLKEKKRAAKELAANEKSKKKKGKKNKRN